MAIPFVQKFRRVKNNQVLIDPEIKRRFANEGAESLPMSRIEFEKFLSEESVKWARVAKLTGIKPE